MHEDVSPNKVIVTVAKALEARFERGDWVDLGILTDTRAIIENHGRRLRSLNWNDPDYRGNVFDVVPDILGNPLRDPSTVATATMNRPYFKSPCLSGLIFQLN